MNTPQKPRPTAQSVLVYRDAEKPNDEKANFEVMIQNEYLSKATKKGSRHWKTREEIKQLEIACQHRDAYKVAKNDFVNRRGKGISNKTMLPLSLQELRNEKDKHLVDKCWALKSVDGTKCLHHIRANKREVMLIPIEDSYDWLFKLHNQDDLHLNGSDMVHYVKQNSVSGFPEGLIRSFPKYCETCKEFQKERNEKKE